MAKLFKILLLALIFSMPLSACAQKQKSVKKMQQEHFDRQEEQKKKAAAAEKKALERHHEIQTKETRKRMKQSEKRSKRLRDNRKEPFLKRWFTRKRR